MLDLERSWQIALPLRGDLPSGEREQSIDSCVRLMLRRPTASLPAPEGHKPWILARLQFVSGLLQPSNVWLLGIPELADPADALRFLLLEEWYDSGRELWPLICEAIAKPDHTLNREVALFS